MAVTNTKSAQLADGYRPHPVEDHGKLRIAYFKATQSGAGDANSTFELCRLPQGRVRIFPGLSRLSCSALGTSRTLDVGHAKYVKGSEGSTEAAVENALANAVDVSGAVAGAALGTGIKFDVYSLGGVLITGKVEGGTVPDGSVLEGFIAYAHE